MEGLELDPWMIEAIKNANPLFLESAVDVRCAPPVEGDFWSKCVEVVSEVNNGMIGRYSNKCIWISVAHGYGKLTGNDVCPTVLIEMSVDRIADHDIFDNVKHTSVLRELEDHLGVNIIVLSGRKKDDKWYVVFPKNMRQRNTIFVLDNWDSCHFQCVTAFVDRDGKRITVPVPDWKIEIQSVPIKEISDAQRRYEQSVLRYERESFTVNNAAPMVQNITIQNMMHAPVQQMPMYHQMYQPMMMPVQPMYYPPMMIQQAPMYHHPMYQQMPYQQSQQMPQAPSVQNMTSFGNYPRYQ